MIVEDVAIQCSTCGDEKTAVLELDRGLAEYSEYEIGRTKEMIVRFEGWHSETVCRGCHE